ncbi:hypothetical protein [Caldiplasma sukawensis]
MTFDQKHINEILESYGTIGMEEYGGMGTSEELILLGMIYSTITNDDEAICRIARDDIEIYKLGEFSYLFWLGSPEDYENEEEKESKDSELMKKLPLAVEGTFTDQEIMDIISGGFI